MNVRLALLIVALMAPGVSGAAEFAVTQCVLPTSNGGTVNCTATGFGTPTGALVWGGYGTANGTVVDHAGLWIGGYDGVRQNSVAFAAEDGQADADTGGGSDSNSALITLLATSQANDGDCTASFITDGIRLTCADAPPVAYRVNVLLVGGSGVSNVYTGTATGNPSIGGTTQVVAPGFQPDIVIAWSANSTTHFRPSIGIATLEGGSTIVQRVMAGSDQDAVATMQANSQLLTNRLVAAGLAIATLELTSFDAGGFTVTTRDSTSGVPTFGYLAINLDALPLKLVTSPSPAGTGTQAITGVGFQPQVGLMLQGEWAAVDTLYSTDDGEVLSLSAFTSASSASSSTYNEDSDGTSNTESMTDNKVCRTRKDNADFTTCTLTSFDADGATYNYTTNVGGVTQRAILYVGSLSTSSSPFFWKRRGIPQ